MMTIKQPQWSALSEASFQLFEDEMVKHLAGFAPELAKVAGPQRLHQLVQRGVQRGRAYGLTQRGPLRSYLETMLSLGSDFDTDPALARATASLRAPTIDQSQRAAALHAGILHYFDQVHGPDDEYALAAIRRVRDVPYEAFNGSGNLGGRALALFRGGFPQKYDYAGEAALNVLLGRAARVGDAYAVRSDAGRLVIAFMLYTFGHGVFSDPAYPWAEETLRHPDISEDQRPEHLHRKARLYLAAVLEHLARP
jgi:hypothetical protein